MTVQELINELMKIEDKSMIVEVIQMMIGEYFTQESERVEIDAKEHTVYIWQEEIMIIKMIVGALFYIMALMIGFLLGKEEMRKEINKDK